ncbi:MAG: SCO1664 family protein [Actinobacteria bacterium]|uniref:Unannotated protein n=1 Tax=freshwater metagenome TaxID=449393 RepID=A0A6J7SD99_9ZZZZ|nr:SCO1664 family protein [Actinomycetota bacterium]
MDVITLLKQGELTVLGRLAGSSNATLLSTVTSLDGTELKCVYKPVHGERPLWDFAEGTLAGREVGAFELIDFLGWEVIPVTVWLDEGPYGKGSVQLWVEESDDIAVVEIVATEHQPQGWLHVLTGENEAGESVSVVHQQRVDLQQIAVLDALMNNADRKAGHVLVGQGDRLWGIDHGLTFHDEPKLRTVLWGWAGERIPKALLKDIEALQENWSAIEQILDEHLAGYEIMAFQERLEELLESGTFPAPSHEWPAIPWPLF